MLIISDKNVLLDIFSLELRYLSKIILEIIYLNIIYAGLD